MAFKFCKHAQVTVLSNGRKKCKCKRDGHIVNNCSEHCPHLTLTLRARWKVWRWRKQHGHY